MVVVDLVDLPAPVFVARLFFSLDWRIVFAFYRSAFIFAFQSCF